MSACPTLPLAKQRCMTFINQMHANAESKHINNPKNKDKIRLDSNGDEIIYEIWHNLTWWDYIVLGFLFILTLLIGIAGIEALCANKTAIFICSVLFGWIGFIFSSYDLFYIRKNRFYITTQGIGFERRKWFRMQRGFYRFGEVGVIETSTSLGLYPANPPSFISVFPLGAIKSKFFLVWQLKPYCVIPLIAWNCYLSQKIYNKAIDAYHLHDFLIKKTKEALRAKGIDTESLPYDLEKQFDI